MFAQGTSAAALEGRLVSGERLLWLGQPDPRRHFTKADFFVVPFSLFWASFAVLWEFGALSGGAPLFFLLWGLPFLAVGAYITVGRFFWKAYRKRHTTYAVTDRRVLIVIDGRFGSTTELDLVRLPGLTHAIRSDGSGDIVFSPTSWTFGMYANTGMRNRGSAPTIAFFDLPDARTPLAILQQHRLPPPPPVLGSGTGMPYR